MRNSRNTWRYARLIVLLACSVSVVGQRSQIPMTNADIIRLTRAKVKAVDIIAAIRLNETNFDTSPSGIEELRKAKVSREVMNVIYEIQYSKIRAEKLQNLQGPTSSPNGNGPPRLEKRECVSWSEIKMSIVVGRALEQPNTLVFGERYPNAIYSPDEKITFRTAKKYQTLYLLVGVEDNPGARGRKEFQIKDERETIYEGRAVPNRRPESIRLDIGGADLIGFHNYDINGEPKDFVRYIDICFVPKKPQ